MDIELKILRYDPENDRKGHWEFYKVEADPDERILDLLHKVKWFEDGTLLLEDLVLMVFVDLMQWL